MFVGRPSDLGNPFTHLSYITAAEYKVNSREEAIEKYKDWFVKAYYDPCSPVRDEIDSLVAKYQDRGELTLICWCHPKPCHAHFLADVIEGLASGSGIMPPLTIIPGSGNYLDFIQSQE